MAAQLPRLLMLLLRQQVVLVVPAAREPVVPGRVAVVPVPVRVVRGSGPAR